LPEGLTAAALPADARLETEFGKVIITRKAEGGRLTIEKQLSLSAVRVPAAKYAEFRKFCLEADRLESERITLVRKAAAPEKDRGREKPASEKEGG
ncbi:MAG TPA: DUF3858 domain-containing protein, partial [Planctomycetota bacterium]|nr:DUF3858 domain-containing protein [Planctomycetota bacterium]